MQSLKQKNKRDEKMREVLKKKVLEFYENNTAQSINQGDVWYNRIIANIDRILKIITSQATAVDSVERKILSLTKVPITTNTTAQSVLNRLKKTSYIEKNID